MFHPASTTGQKRPCSCPNGPLTSPPPDMKSWVELGSAPCRRGSTPKNSWLSAPWASAHAAACTSAQTLRCRFKRLGPPRRRLRFRLALSGCDTNGEWYAAELHTTSLVCTYVRRSRRRQTSPRCAACPLRDASGCCDVVGLRGNPPPQNSSHNPPSSEQTDGYFHAVSTLAEIEEAIVRLPDPQVEELEAWLSRRRTKTAVAKAPEPDFLSRAKAVWGNAPTGKPLSELVSEGRG